MSATAAMEIGSDLWNARVYAGLSVAYELAAGAEKPRNRLAFFLSVYRTYLQVYRLSSELDAILAAAEQAVPLYLIADAETYRLRRDMFLQLYTSCSRLVSLQDRLPLYGKLREKMARLGVQAERLLDLADWFDALSTPEEIEAKFESLAADVAEGNYVSLASMQ
jgi:hypothetical protein